MNRRACLCLLVVVAGAGLARAEPLSMEQVLDLHAGGVDEELLLELVRRDCVDFDVNAENLGGLSAALPKEVVTEMLRCRQVRAPADATVAEISLENLDPNALAVIPFTGTADFRTLAAETLTSELVGATDLRLIQPELVLQRATAIQTDLMSGSLSISDVQGLAARSEAGLALMGDISAYREGGTLNAIATLKLVDVASGEVIASAQRKSGLLVANSQQQCVVRAVKRALNDLRPSLRWLSR